MKTLNDFHKYVENMAEEIIQEVLSDEPGIEGDEDIFYEYANDLVHEYVDQCEYVIYYGKAWDLVEMLRKYEPSRLDLAESARADLCAEFKSLDQLMCELAYCALELAIGDAVYNLVNGENESIAA